MTLEELGAALRAEREKRGLSVDDVAARLKIGVRQLRALEEGDTAGLPHPAYAKGFIRSYAAYVGLAAEEVNAALTALNSALDPTPPQSVYEPERLLTPHRNLKPFLALAAALLLAGLGWLAWRQGALDFLTSQTRRLAQPTPEAEVVPSRERAVPLSAAQSPQVAEAPVPAPQATPAPQQRAPEGASNDAEPGTAGSPAAAAATAREAVPALVGTPGWGGQPAATPAASTGQGQAGQGQSSQAQAGEEQGGPHKVILTALEECWVHSNADSTDTRQFSLRKGDTFALTFSKSLELKLGNAGGVRLRYDGQDLPPAGQSGQVRTLRFPPPAQP
jgi:cytoskeleton protein RodZ